ncbi:MAG: permease [Candidatus Aminicenantes bacterium]|nr:permease [Candidatus Aminicenantes bacterium]
MKEAKIFALLAAVFPAAYFIPFSRPAVQNGINEGLLMVQEYAREHVLLCLIPAFFIAGAISVFVRKDSIIKLMGPKSPKVLAYGIASVSGSILAVCSCTVLPLFAGIYTRGAGIGPASAFLYSGPAINILAIIMTARVLGAKIGLARALGAVVFSVVIGLLMHVIFGRTKGKDEKDNDFASSEGEKDARPLWKTVLYMAVMIGILVIVNWSRGGSEAGFFYNVYKVKWIVGGALLAVLAWMIVRWFRKDELKEWVFSTWVFAKQIFPLLIGGVMVAGFLLGRPGYEGIIPNSWVAGLVGGNGLWANLFASVAGAFMYFATLTEVPILQGLLGSGMGQGPALALLLAGPALSLPSMLVVRQVFGTKKALVYILLVIVMAAVTGLIFGGVF